MKPQLFALITAMAWGIGGYFEKKGLHLGHLSPQVGMTIRTAVALVVLSEVSAPQWGSVRNTIYTKQFPTGSWLGVKELALPEFMIEIELEVHKAN